MPEKKIKLTIDSRLDYVPLIGVAINRVCSFASLSDVECNQIELCAVEAITNSIKHAYKNEPDHEVEVVVKLGQDRFTIEVRDSGKSMDQGILRQKEFPSLKVDPNNVESISEGGRGIAIIKEIMDEVIYKTEKGKNYLIMTKKVQPK